MSIDEIIKKRATRKLYLDDPWLATCRATILEITTNGVRLDQTVSFPEGGGQEGDRGQLVTLSDDAFKFRDTQKEPGRQIFRPGFSGLNVQTPIYHIFDDETMKAFREKCRVGDTISIQIDIDRRARLTVSHSASHMLYIAIGLVRPEAIPSTIGCHIKEEEARFDFSVESKFNNDELVEIARIANELISKNDVIRQIPLDDEPEALIWQYMQYDIPCGGTHLITPESIGGLDVSRRSIGKGKDRVICRFPNAAAPISKYHHGRVD